MADFTKSGAQVDEWSQISTDSVRVGAATNIDTNVGNLLEITVAHDSTNAHANGALVKIQVSSDATPNEEDWIDLPSGEFRSSGGTATQANVDLTSSSETLYVDLTTGFQTQLKTFFVKDATIANSEVGTVKTWSVDNYILCAGTLTNAHTSSADVFNIVDQWVVRIPAEFRHARVLIHNDDADCTICSRVRKALATDIE